MKTPLAGHTTPETAYVVADYPYGFTLRCQIRYWIETKAKVGQRVMSQTTNPKRPGVVWNKPKASTYSAIRVLYLAENGHVENDGLGVYSETADILKFADTYRAAFTERDERVIKQLAFLAAQADTKREARRVAAEQASFDNKHED